MALLALLRGDQAEQELFGRAAAFTRANRIATEADLGPLFDTPPASDAPDIAEDIRVPLGHVYTAGAWVLLESALADIPPDLRWLHASGAVTIEQLAAMYGALGCTTAAEVADASRSGALARISGFDDAAAGAVIAALPGLRAAVPRMPLGRALATADPILDHLRALPGIDWVVPAGSLRRGEDTVGDIQLVAAAADPAPALESLHHLPIFDRCLHRSARRMHLLLDRVPIGVRFASPERAGAVLLQFTGSAAHLEQLRTHADAKGWRLTADGLFAADGAPYPTPTEADIYAALGLPYIPAEIRSGGDEIAAAAHGQLPRLVSRSDLRGDLHMHTQWSDGRDSIEAMVSSCRALGYEYLAITDHSQRSAASRNLTIKGVTAQAEEIARVREQHPDITILHGCEVDILPDGRLDFTDRILERFDIVLASLHDRAGQDGDQLLKRYTAAMNHPLVSIITHPTNRLVPTRRGYDLDYDRLFELAVRTGTVVEIDGAPVHLDLDGALARRAIAAGATLVVDSDAHRTEALDRQMDLGILMARRGWVEARHVMNTRPLSDVRALVASKRSP